MVGQSDGRYTHGGTCGLGRVARVDLYNIYGVDITVTDQVPEPARCMYQAGAYMQREVKHIGSMRVLFFDSFIPWEVLLIGLP